jgi:hypothetical protein
MLTKETFAELAYRLGLTVSLEEELGLYLELAPSSIEGETNIFFLRYVTEVPNSEFYLIEEEEILHRVNSLSGYVRLFTRYFGEDFTENYSKYKALIKDKDFGSL